MNARQLFQGARVRLDALDPEKDADTLSAWSHDMDFARRMNAEPYPVTASAARKRMEAWVEETDKRESISLALRRTDGARLLGTLRIEQIVWPHRTAQLKLGIGSSVDRGQGLGKEALDLILRYCFDELNMHRLSASIQSHNPEALRFFTRNGFVEEARLRGAFAWNGARWDDVWLGLLRSEWAQAHAEAGR